jgi:hypothetical protein
MQFLGWDQEPAWGIPAFAMNAGGERMEQFDE